MDFPDLASLIRHAAMLKFRPPHPNEDEAAYRIALADFVRPMDVLEAEEILNKKGWDKFSQEDNQAMLRRIRFPR
jgi:hypothetical protein